MAIKFSAGALTNFFSHKIFRHPMLVAWLAAVGLLVWIGLGLMGVLFDQPLAPEKISAHRLRVNSGQLTSLTKAITAYQTAQAQSTIREDLFGAATK